jgi:hypothetical protein
VDTAEEMQVQVEVDKGDNMVGITDIRTEVHETPPSTGVISKGILLT